MELSRSYIKKYIKKKKAFPIFFQKKVFSIFSEMEPCVFQLKLEKIEKIQPQEKFLILQKTKTLKIFLYIFPKESFPY